MAATQSSKGRWGVMTLAAMLYVATSRFYDPWPFLMINFKTGHLPRWRFSGEQSLFTGTLPMECTGWAALLCLITIILEAGRGC